MSCQDYEIALGDYVDGTLDERSRIEVEAHLSACERCRAIVEDFSVLRQATLSLEPELPAPHVWTKLQAAFEAEQRSSVHGWSLSWRQSLAASLVTAMLVDRKTAFRGRLAWTEPAPARFIALVIGSSLVINGLTPYFGIQFHHAAAMLSNLRIDDGCHNSFVFPASMRLSDPYVRIDRIGFAQHHRQAGWPNRDPRAQEASS